MENAENAVVSMIEIQSFSNKNITEAKTIINKACDGMRIMGYVRQYGPKRVQNAADTNIFRMVARFRRIVSSVDEIENLKPRKHKSFLIMHRRSKGIVADRQELAGRKDGKQCQQD